MTPQLKKADELVERFRNFEYKDSEDTVIHKNPYKATSLVLLLCQVKMNLSKAMW